MSPERLLKHFGQISEAPDAVPRLRRFILDLAVRGLLGTNAAKETVSSSIPEVFPNPKPFGAPANWRWTEFGEIALIAGGFAFKSGDYTPTGIFVLRVTNIEPTGGIDKTKAVFFPKEKVTREIDKFFLNAGDILLVMVGGSLGKIGVVTDDILPALLNQNLWRITPGNKEVDVSFLRLLIDFLVSFQREITHSTHGHLSREEFRRKPIALPPLAEQHRIVAKVDELTALCDRLEAAQAKREKRRDRMVAATLHGLNNGETSPAHGTRSTFKDSARFYLNHLPRLTTRPEHIRQLRQTILNLAVRGKLVSQDLADEPIHKILRRISEQRAKLVRAKKVRHKKTDDFINPPKRGDFPNNWAVERLGNLVDPENRISYGVLVPGNDVESGIPFVRAQDLSLSSHPNRPNKTISPEVEKPYARTRLRGGEILLCVVGSIGKLGVVPPSWAGANIARAVVRIMPIHDICQDYLLLVLRGQPVQTYFLEATRTLAQPTLNVGLIEQTPIPLPPIAEQQRISTKVHKLMALCDELENQLSISESGRLQLAEATLYDALPS